MARLQLDFPPDQFRYATTLNVRSTDINGARHLGNEAMVAMLSEARSLFLFAHGIAETRQDRLGIIVSDLAVSYRAEARVRDQLLFDVGVMDFNRYGGDMVFRVSRPADGTLVALAKYGFVFFDYQQGKVTAMPADFRARFPQANGLE